jgi:GTP-binding protein
VIGLNKADAIPADELKAKRTKLKRAAKRDVYVLSGATQQGVPEVLAALLKTINEARNAPSEAKLAEFQP